MRRLSWAAWLLAAATAVSAADSAGVTSDSPAARRIEAVRARIAAQPDDAGAHHELALALARRARETSDVSFYEQAQQAVERSLALAADNFEARKMAVWLMLGRHEFARARDAAIALNRRAPDDLQVYAFLVDAHVELGDYAAAEAAAQWMLDLRPASVPALTRAAYLRELFGDPEGALQLLHQAYPRIPPDETEERAWLLTQVGLLHLSTGALGHAEAALAQALLLFPDYHYALGGMAEVRLAQGRATEAVALLDRRFRAAPHPENQFALARALARAGEAGAARAAFRTFEATARAEVERADNANHELVAYYVDDAGRAADALSVARSERARRQDVRTLAAHAWALSATGRHREARAEIDRALAVGWRSAELRYRAGVIAARQGDRQAAREHLREAMAISPVAEPAREAARLLARLGAPARGRLGAR